MGLNARQTNNLCIYLYVTYLFRTFFVISYSLITYACSIIAIYTYRATLVNLIYLGFVSSLRVVLFITQAVRPGFKFRLSFFFFFTSLSHKSPSGLYRACVTFACVQHMEFAEVVVVKS